MKVTKTFRWLHLRNSFDIKINFLICWFKYCATPTYTNIFCWHAKESTLSFLYYYFFLIFAIKRFYFLTVLVDGSHFSCDSLVYDTLLLKETIEVTVFCILRNCLSPCRCVLNNILYVCYINSFKVILKKYVQI